VDHRPDQQASEDKNQIESKHVALMLKAVADSDLYARHANGRVPAGGCVPLDAVPRQTAPFRPGEASIDVYRVAAQR